MQSKEYGLAAIDELALHLSGAGMTLNPEEPKELTVSVDTRQPSGGGFWHKVVGEIILPPDMAGELARSHYKDVAKLVGERGALDVYELLVNGDLDSEDQYLATLDGAKKRGAKHVTVTFASEGALLEIKGSGKKGIHITFTAYFAAIWA